MPQFNLVTGQFEETEEERRKRAEQAAQTEVGKTEIITRADGSQTRTVTEEIPGGIPRQTFNRMLQAESGNRQFTPQGQVVTSPKGALGAGQVMPATAMQPGFGVPDIFQLAQQRGVQFANRDEATARQLLGNEQLNREFAFNYANAMARRFGPQAAPAAYNAGPGAIQRNMAANQGRLNVAQLPQETQGYMDKVLGTVGRAVNAVIPSAQAQTTQPQQQQPRPPQQPMPGRGSFGMPLAQPEEGVAVATGQGVQGTTAISPEEMQRQIAAAQRSQQFSLAQGQGMQGLRLGTEMPAAAAPTPGLVQTQEQYQNIVDKTYEKIQDNIDELSRFRLDPNTPEYLRRRAGDRMFEMMDRQRKEEEAKAQMANIDPRTAGRILTTEPKDDITNYIKYFLLQGFAPDLAKDFGARKLGIGSYDQAVIGPDNKSYMITFDAFKSPIRGISADGKQLTQEQLTNVAANAAAAKGAEVGTQVFMDPSGVVKGTYVLERRPGGSVYKEIGSNRIATSQESAALRPTGVGGTLADQRARQIQEINLRLQGKGVEEAMGILRKFNEQLAAAGYPIVQPSEVGLQVPQIGGAATGAATTAGTQQSAAAVARPTGPQLAAQAAAGKEIVTDAAKQVAASADTQNMLKSIDNVVAIIDSGQHNIGSIGSTLVGRGRIAQALGQIGETDDAKNTRMIMDTVNKLAADGLKTLGSNPSTVDLEFWTKYKPDATSDPRFVKEWIESRSEDLKRRLGYAQQQVSTGGTAGTAPTVARETKQKPLSADDRKAIEWARNNPNDPRAAEIKRTLGL